MNIGDYFVPNGVSPRFQWGCRCKLIAISETEYTFEMYNGSEFRLRISDFRNTNWMPYHGTETEISE